MTATLLTPRAPMPDETSANAKAERDVFESLERAAELYRQYIELTRIALPLRPPEGATAVEYSFDVPSTLVFRSRA